MNRRHQGLFGKAVAVGAALTVMVTTACSPSPQPGGEELTADQAKDIAIEAYLYGYSLVTIEMTRRVMTNVEHPAGARAPMGQLLNMRSYPDAKFRDITAPNADTLYSNGFIDVKDQPWVLHLPDAHDRYYLFPMLDAYSNVFEVPGKRTTGTGAQTYAITGPSWHGTLPAGVTEYKSPTSTVWLLGRIYCDGTPQDYQAVHEVQDEITLQPLSTYGKSFSPPVGRIDPAIDMKTPVRDQVNGMSAEAFFTLLATLMKDNPPTDADGPIVAKMSRIGIEPGKPFDINKFGTDIAAAIGAAPGAALDRVTNHFKETPGINGWTFTTKTGRYGTDYLQRATITYFGLGANLPEDAVYPTSSTGADGRPYDGANTYTLHFDKGKFPPVHGFWSLTMYDAGFFFADNPLNRYTLSQRNNFVTNADGSVDLYLQHDTPGPERAANWLPTPTGVFNVMMRLYWPTDKAPSIIDGSWQPPAIVQAH